MGAQNLTPEQELEKLWKKFKTGLKFETIEKKDFYSLSELLLKQESPEQFAVYDQLKDIMIEFWDKDHTLPPIIDKKDYTHANRICHYLDRILFDCNSSGAIPVPIIELSTDDLFVLLCSVQIHDYGKGRHEWTYLSVLFDFMEDEFRRYDLLEKEEFRAWWKNRGSHEACVNYLDKLEINRKEPDNKNLLDDQCEKACTFLGEIEASSKTADNYNIVEEYHCKNIRNFFYYIIYVNENSIDRQQLSFFEKELFRTDSEKKLLSLLIESGKITGEHLARIQSISSSHKKLSYHPESDLDFYYNEAGNDQWLCSLLRLADSLDMDRNRIEKPGTHDVIAKFNRCLDGESDTFLKHYKNTFSIWLKFLLLSKIEINHRFTSRMHCLDITLCYNRFTQYKKHFLTVRYLSEKDFWELNFLKKLQNKIHNNRKKSTLPFKINLIYRMVDNSDSEYPELNMSSEINEWFNRKKIEAIRKLSQIAGASNDEFSLFQLKNPYSTMMSFMPDSDRVLPDLSYLPQSLVFYSILTLLQDGEESIDGINTQIGRQIGGEQLVLKGIGSDQLQGANFIIESENGKRDEAWYKLSTDPDDKKNYEALFKSVELMPNTIKSKIREISEFKAIFPFSLKQCILRTGISGLDEVISNSLKSQKGIKNCRNILIKGGAGTGKTSLAYQILNNAKIQGYQVLFISFEEKKSRLSNEFEKNFGFSANVEYLSSFGKKFNTIEKEEELRIVFKEFKKVASVNHHDVFAIDSLNRLKDYFRGEALFETFVRELFTFMATHQITCFYVSEEESHPFSEYAADGIFYLKNDQGYRSIEIKKLRNQAYIQGEHKFEIVDKKRLSEFSDGRLEKEWLHRGINVFPNTRLYRADIDNTITTENTGDGDETIPTGIEGLDALLPARQGAKGFIKNNIILIIGSPGSGKTVAGLQFIKRGIDDGEKCLWVTFEGSRQDLYNTICRFDKDLALDKLFSESHASKFLFQYFPPAYFQPDELVFAVRRIVENHGNVKRLVIDSISEIEELFPHTSTFKNFIATFIQQLRVMGITTVFLYRSSQFFGFQKHTETSISSLVDTIISFKTFDIKNRIKKGLFILKSRGREQRSDLQTMEITSEEGIVVSDKGWELEGLLSGETGEIKEPYIFLKLFYENPAEDIINRHMIADFEKRYPGDNSKFTSVRKPQIYSEFWSFKGHHGAGHANIRIVSLSKYMVEAFRENDRLHTLSDYFSSALLTQTQADPRWKKYQNKQGKFDFLPCYNDFGMLVTQKHLFSDTDEKVSEKWIEEIRNPIEWTRLTRLGQEISAEVKKRKKDKNRPLYCFAMPPLGTTNASEFIAFFMEILWSFGGDIFNLPALPSNTANYTESKSRLQQYKNIILTNSALHDELGRIIKDPEERERAGLKKEDIELYHTNLEFLKKQGSNNGYKVISIDNKKALEALSFIVDLVLDKEGCPNPISGDYRSQAVFSRKWYSDIREFEEHITAIEAGVDDFYIYNRDGIMHDKDPRQEELKAAVKDKGLRVHISHLPYNQKTKKSCTSQGAWCLSIIKEALSPEIGWIFIDSMVSQEILRMRCMERLGLPVKIEDVRSDDYKRHDAPAYKIVEKIMATDSDLEKNSILIANAGQDSINLTELKKIFKQLKPKYNLVELKQLSASIKNKQKEATDQKAQRRLSNVQKHIDEKIEELGNNQKELFCSKLRANRPYFYIIENILCRYLRELFEKIQLYEEEKRPFNKMTNIEDTLEKVRKDFILEIFKQPSAI